MSRLPTPKEAYEKLFPAVTEVEAERRRQEVADLLGDVRRVLLGEAPEGTGSVTVRRDKKTVLVRVFCRQSKVLKAVRQALEAEGFILRRGDGEDELVIELSNK